MSLADEFKEAAKELIDEFYSGEYTYLFPSSESYDPNDGSVTSPETPKTIPAARYNISTEKKATMSYSEDTCIVVMAGIDLEEVVPEAGGAVVFPEGTRHRIVLVEPDQYGAAYFLHVTRTPDGA
jgi:hypothetical protein